MNQIAATRLVTGQEGGGSATVGGSLTGGLFLAYDR
jgi:hypothetical protein